MKQNFHCFSNKMVTIFYIISGITADRQYVNDAFIRACRAAFQPQFDGDNSPFHVPVCWDAAHFLNLAVTDIRDAKREFSNDLSVYLSRFIKRSNLFCHLFGRGKNFSLLKGIAREENLTL